MSVELVSESKNRDTYKVQWQTEEDTVNSAGGKGEILGRNKWILSREPKEFRKTIF